MEPLNTLQKIKQHTTEGAALKTLGRRVHLIVRIPELKKTKKKLQYQQHFTATLGNNSAQGQMYGLTIARTPRTLMEGTPSQLIIIFMSYTLVFDHFRFEIQWFRFQ